jgi:hypothetical protein
MAQRGHERARPHDLADKAVGYSSSGESEYSRHAAHSQNLKLPGYREGAPGSGPKVRGPRSSTALIKENVRALAKLERDARREIDPIRLAKLLKNVGIKKRFLEKIEGTTSTGSGWDDEMNFHKGD